MPKGFGAELIAALGRPLAAPSANSSGRISATTAAAVEADLGATHSADRRWRADPGRAGIDDRQGRGRLRPAAQARRHRRRGDRGADRQAAGPRRSGGHRGAGMLASHYAPGARCGVDAARSSPARRCSPSGRPRSSGSGKAVACAQPVAERAICARPPPIFSMICRRSTAAARPIAVEPIPITGSAKPSTIACARRRTA